MRVVAWSILFLFVVGYTESSFCSTKKRRSADSLSHHVDAVLKEIDVVYSAHDHGGGAHNHAHGADDAHEAHGHDHGSSMGDMAMPETPEQKSPVKPAPQAQVEKKEIASMQSSTKDVSNDNAANIERAKKQIKAAEAEIKKLKELVKAAEATPVASDIIRIIQLNKELIKVFEKQIEDYHESGMPYDSPRIQQAQKNIRVAQRELDIYEKQLRKIKNSALKAIQTEETDQSKSKNEPSPASHAHGAPIEAARKPVSTQTPIPPASHAHNHGAAPTQTQKETPASHEHAHPSPERSGAQSKGSVEKKGQPAAHEHQHAAPAPTSDQSHEHEHGAPPVGDHGSMPGMADGGHEHGGAAGGGAYEQSEAFKSAHAWHASGLNPSQFHFHPFGYVQSEISYATRQMLALQEHQIFLVPADEALDHLMHDVEDRSQFFTALHVHTGALVTGPEILNAKPTADISFEYYGPLPLNYAPLNSPAYNVPQITPTFDAKIGGEFLVHGTLFVEWEKTTLLFGQTWHPGADPIVAVANDRVTFFGQMADPLNRFFQVRVTQKVGKNLEFIAALCQYIDNKTKFNLGVEVEQTSNVGWFNFHFQARAQMGKNVYALAADIYTEQPRLFENTKLVLDQDLVSIGVNDVFPPSEASAAACLVAPSTSGFQDACGVYATKLAVSSFSMMGFAKIDRDPVVAKAKVLVGSNLGHPFGGFAILNDCSAQDPLKDTGIRVYGPLRIATLALDFYVKSKFEPGIYLGFTKNLGSTEQIWAFKDTSPSHIPCTQEQIVTGDTTTCLTTQDRFTITVFRYLQNLDYTVVIAPRLKWNVAPVTFSAELEYSKFGYGDITRFGGVTCVHPIECTRVLVEAYFNF